MAIKGSITGLTTGFVGPIAGDIVLTVGSTSVVGGTPGHLLSISADGTSLDAASPVGIGTVTSVGVGLGLTSTQIPITSFGTISLDLTSNNIWSGMQSFANAGMRLQGSGLGYTTFQSLNTGPTNYTLSIPAMNSTFVLLDSDNAFTNNNWFKSGKLRIQALTGTGYSDFVSINNGTNAYDLTVPNASGTLALLEANQIFTGASRFSTLQLKGSGTGFTTLASANTGGVNYTITFPAANGTVTLLEQPNTFLNLNSFNLNATFLAGLTVGATASNQIITLNGTAGSTSLHASNSAVSTNFALPSNNGTSGFVLKTDGFGNTFWDTAALTIATTTISGGTNLNVLYNNNGVLGQYPVTGSGSVALSASPTFTGAPIAPTQTVQDNSAKIATTLYTYNEISWWYTNVLTVNLVVSSGGNMSNVTCNTQSWPAGNNYVANTYYADYTAQVYGAQEAQYYSGNPNSFGDIYWYAFLMNMTGSGTGYGGQLPGSYLVTSDSAASSGQYVAGTWDACGTCGSAYGTTLWRRVA